jgi:hypothetical protein
MNPGISSATAARIAIGVASISAASQWGLKTTRPRSYSGVATGRNGEGNLMTTHAPMDGYRDRKPGGPRKASIAAHAAR